MSLSDLSIQISTYQFLPWVGSNPAWLFSTRLAESHLPTYLTLPR